MPRTIEVTDVILRDGHQSLSDIVVERFAAKSADNGMDVFRVFDALNAVPNVKCPIAAVNKAGKHAQGTPAYDIVKAINGSLGEKMRIHVHVHATTG
jgi:methylmalonyl-CoA carboxyltransferase 5S subunit